MSNVFDKANRVKRLVDSDEFRGVIEGVKSRQHKVFGNPGSTPEQIAEAHSVIRAMGKIDDYVTAVMNEARVENHKVAKLKAAEKQ